MPRYVEMDDASAVVSQNQEHVKHLKSDGRHSEEVHRDHALDVILQEGLPGLRGWIAPAYEILAHAGFADVDAQLEQFTGDARRTPADCRGSSCESVAESLWTPVDARVGHD